MSDDTTFPAAVAPLVEDVLTTCRAQLTEGPVTATTYIVNSSAKTITPVEMYMPTEVAKDMSADVARWMAKNAKADATIAVSEAWSLSEQDSPRHAEIIKQYGSIGEYPGRLDILTVNVQTHDGVWMGRAPIITEGRARRFGPLEVVKAGKSDGRFTNFLPPKEEEDGE
jgi:hypothetical protein